MNEPQSLEADNTNVIRLSGSVFLDTFVGNLHQHGIHTALYHAALLGISRTELCACVQTLTGMNYSDFTDNYILLMANDILKDKKIDLNAVSKRLGFGSYLGFYRFVMRNMKEKPVGCEEFIFINDFF